MTRISQKERIKEINNNLLFMADLVEKQICGCMIVLKKHDVKMAEEIMLGDDKVDDLQKVIEEECIKFIATEQPLAKDLRNVFTAIKIVTEFERMADYAVDVCKIVKKNKAPDTSILEEALPLWDMEEMVRKMINLSINAFIERDVEKAYEICKMDDQVDALYRRIFSDIIKNITKDESSSEKTAQLLFVAKYLERIGDRVTNICEGTIFVKTGAYVDLNE